MRVLDLIIKDLKIWLSDKKAIGITILMPIILTTILGGALGSSFAKEGSRNKVDIAIVRKYDAEEETEKFVKTLSNNTMINMDEKSISEVKNSLGDMNIDKIFNDQMLESDEIQKIINYRFMEEDEALKAVENKEVAAVVILPKGFVYDMYINFLTPFRNKVNIDVIGHPDMNISTQIVNGIMTGFSDGVSSIVIGKNVFIETAIANGMGANVFENMEEITEGLTDILEQSAVNINYRKVKGQKPMTGFQYYAVAITAMFILFTAGESSKTLLEEKENLTYQRMVIAGTSKWQIVTGKFFTIFVFSILQIGVMILFTNKVLGVNWGDPLLVGITTACAVFAVAGLGTMLAAITYRNENYKLTEVFQSVIVQILAFLGGSFFPLENFPKFFNTMSYFTLNGLALKAYQKIMLGNGIGKIITSLLGLIAMGIVFTLIATFLLKEKEGWKYVKYNKVKAYEIKE
ncbi:ABC transporter permease [Caldisalinibacter kiritimatiensis]|uniref:ABC-2 type transporter n=1 Tax=Caldisalinibacter kiritimatiensis TaxID=1304284 RepID=R1CB81_9FIRM|nr:ABC transporter permease [Caldisalinibacter kiritimatiensis]EOC99564.1 ABC-2 type transporter [Caldisalinibacter kiritimatiensis]